MGLRLIDAVKLVDARLRAPHRCWVSAAGGTANAVAGALVALMREGKINKPRNALRVEIADWSLFDAASAALDAQLGEEGYRAWYHASTCVDAERADDVARLVRAIVVLDGCAALLDAVDLNVIPGAYKLDAVAYVLEKIRSDESVWPEDYASELLARAMEMRDQIANGF